MKGRACANGRKQREYIEKEEVTSTMVVLDSIFITAAVEAHKIRDVAVIVLPDAFLHEDCKDKALMIWQ